MTFKKITIFLQLSQQFFIKRYYKGAFYQMPSRFTIFQKESQAILNREIKGKKI